MLTQTDAAAILIGTCGAPASQPHRRLRLVLHVFDADRFYRPAKLAHGNGLPFPHPQQRDALQGRNRQDRAREQSLIPLNDNPRFWWTIIYPEHDATVQRDDACIDLITKKDLRSG